MINQTDNPNQLLRPRNFKQFTVTLGSALIIIHCKQQSETMNGLILMTEVGGSGVRSLHYKQTRLTVGTNNVQLSQVQCSPRFCKH